MRLLAHEDDVVITSEDTIAGRIPRGSSGTIEIYLPRISRQESYKSVENMNQYLTNISIVYILFYYILYYFYFSILFVYYHYVIMLL